MSTTLPVRLSTMRTTYGLRRTIRNSWMSAHCGKSSHMKKSSTLPSHHKRRDEREGGNEDGERQIMVMQMKTSDQACVHQSQIHSQSLRIEVVEPAAQKTKRCTARNEQNPKKELCSWICQNEQMPEQRGYDAVAFKSKSKKKKITAIIWQIPI